MQFWRGQYETRPIQRIDPNCDNQSYAQIWSFAEGFFVFTWGIISGNCFAKKFVERRKAVFAKNTALNLNELLWAN